MAVKWIGGKSCETLGKSQATSLTNSGRPLHLSDVVARAAHYAYPVGSVLTRHDWPITALHIVVFGLSAWVGIMCYELAKATLRGDDSSAFAWQPFLRWVIGYQRKAVQIVMGIIFVLSMGAIYSPFSWTPVVYSYLPFFPFAELVEEEISIKPTTWTG